MSVLHARLALAIVGVATWGYGVRFDRSEVRWLGIALLAVSLLLRFSRRRPTSRPENSPPDG